ncbi:hypothetical protein SADUNF_Sadunf16G0033800 [Salix dunnii]|uniref:Mitochondrial protein n=1 Tax=Salix dunnii TaxID=1413687 RepID=A0A835JC61_9ROSI|nr:hypothetical protein SADUNF_Sadunf16G0033800 [Salix dunnii]
MYILIYIDDTITCPYPNLIVNLIRMLRTIFIAENHDSLHFFSRGQSLLHSRQVILNLIKYINDLRLQSKMLIAKDSDWVGFLEDPRSTNGFCFYFGPNIISWSSHKQKSIYQSSTNAEYRAIPNITTEIINYLCSFISL